ncbi:hypothetical protein [Paenibacillus sp. NPDC055715]
MINVMDGIRPRYMIKQNDPVIVEAEAEFVHTVSGFLYCCTNV